MAGVRAVVMALVWVLMVAWCRLSVVCRGLCGIELLNWAVYGLVLIAHCVVGSCV